MTAARSLLLIACWWAGAMAQASAAPQQQQELDSLRKHIHALQQDLEKASESKSEAADALRESERAISDRNRKLADLSAQQQQASLALQTLQQQARELGITIQGQQTQLGKLLYQQYTSGQQESLQLLLNSRDPNQIARDLQYFEYIARNRAEWIHTLRVNLARLTAIHDATQQKSQEIAALQSEELAQKRHLEQQKRSRSEVLSNLSQQIQQQRREINRLRQNEERLSQLVARLAKLLAAKPKPKPVPPKAAAPNAPAETVVRNEAQPDGHFDGTPFERLKGKLTLPVRGAVGNQFGAMRPDSTLAWKGLFVRAASGQPVRAVAAGRVVFADWLRGFGNLLIVDHGDGYMSLYGNNETLYKQVGDVLHGGDTIASVGNSGGNEASGLYFELRHQGAPFDPLKWVAVK